MSIQVAGHEDSIVAAGKYLIKFTTDREAEFYDQLEEDHAQYAKYIPRCYRIENTGLSGHQSKCIILENLAHGHERHCAMDLKMGVKNYRDGAPIERVLKSTLKAVTTTSATLGIRISGWSEWESGAGSVSHDKSECYAYGEVDFRRCLRRFLRWPGLIERAKTIIDEMWETLSAQHDLRLYGSSLLITYDAMRPAETLDVSLIDFSNYYELKGQRRQDDGWVRGLRTLRDTLEALFISERLR